MELAEFKVRIEEEIAGAEKQLESVIARGYTGYTKLGQEVSHDYLKGGIAALRSIVNAIDHELEKE